MAGIHVRFEVTPESFLSNLTDAAYKVALKHGFKAPFDEVELDLLKALRKIMEQDMQVSPACGNSKVCLEAEHLSPWSQESQKLFREEK